MWTQVKTGSWGNARNDIIICSQIFCVSQKTTVGQKLRLHVDRHFGKLEADLLGIK